MNQLGWKCTQKKEEIFVKKYGRIGYWIDIDG